MTIKGSFYEISPCVGYAFDLKYYPRGRKTPVVAYGISMDSVLRRLVNIQVEEELEEEYTDLKTYLEDEYPKKLASLKSLYAELSSKINEQAKAISAAKNK